MFRDAAVIDFETYPIEARPFYPPKPVGVAISVPGKRPQYIAWDHPGGGNKQQKGDAKKALGELYDSGRPLLFHNAKFDLEVAQKHLGLKLPHWSRIHDTMPMLFLHNPRAENYRLKPASEELLGLPPEERDAVEEWLIINQPVEGVRLRASKRGKTAPGAYIAYAPPKLVGKYAIGDVTRTRKLALYCYKQLKARGMLDAYDRERQLIPPILDMEQQGVRVDLKRLGKDLQLYMDVGDKLREWLQKRLKCKDLNINSGQQLAEALIKAKVAKEEDFGVTESGKLCTNKEALQHAVKDKQILAVLSYRAKLVKCVTTFMGPWHQVAKETGGLIYTTWHTTRTDENGARTGRMSSTPNFQNLARAFKEVFAEGTKPPFELPPLPLLRSYIIPHDKDHVLIDRDFSGQEIRILAHFERGALLDAYNENPWLDPHETAGRFIEQLTGKVLDRYTVKTLWFGIIYGMGLGKLSEKLEITVNDARDLKNALLRAFPGVRKLNQEMRQRADNGEPIHTWGGREYYVEDPKVINGEFRSFAYKLMNILIQGSAADCTKEALLRYYEKKPKKHKVMLVTHDQITVSVPRKERDRAMKQLRAAMEAVQFDVPMLSEGKWSHTHFAALKDYDKKGKVYAR